MSIINRLDCTKPASKELIEKAATDSCFPSGLHQTSSTLPRRAPRRLLFIPGQNVFDNLRAGCRIRPCSWGRLMVMVIGSKSFQGCTSLLAEKIQHLGSTNVDGGVHPRFCTRNFTPPPQNGQYMKVVYSLDYPTTEQVPWSQVSRKRTNEGRGWLTWVHVAEEIPKIEKITITGTDHLSDSWFKTDNFGGLSNIHFKFIDPSAHDDECGIVANLLTIPSGVVRLN